MTAQEFAPLMFLGLIAVLLIGFPVAFSLSALGLLCGFVAIEAGWFPAAFMGNLPLTARRRSTSTRSRCRGPWTSSPTTRRGACRSCCAKPPAPPAHRARTAGTAGTVRTIRTIRTATMRVQGPSYPPAVRLAATLLMAAVALAFTRALPRLRLVEWEPSAVALIVLLALIAVAGYIAVLTGATCVDDDSLQQRTLWTRSVRLADIRQARLVQFPGLNWLFVPRLVVRTSAGVVRFTAGDARLLQALRDLQRAPGAGAR